MISRPSRWAGADLAPLAYESVISCLLRFAWRNVLDHATLRQHFSSMKGRFVLDLLALQEQTGWSIPDGQDRDFTAEHTQAKEHWLSERFRYCPLCLECGYHSDLFQCMAIACCPFHEVALSELCHCCSGWTPKVSESKRLFDSPYECSACGEALSGVRPSLEAHLDFRANFASVESALKPYSRWWRQFQAQRSAANSMRPRACTGRQAQWCNIPEFIRAVACKGIPAPKCARASRYPDNLVVILDWHSRISLGNTADFFDKRQSSSDRVGTGQGVYRSTLKRLGRWIAREEGWTAAQFEDEVRSFRIELAPTFSVRFLAFVSLRCQLEQRFTMSNEIELWPQRQAQLEDISLSDGIDFNGRTSRLGWKAVFLAVYASWYERIAAVDCVSLRILWESGAGHRAHIFSRNKVRSRQGEVWYDSAVFNPDEAWFEGAVSFLRIEGMPMSPWDARASGAMQRPVPSRNG
jgi:hypothetical protein